MVKPQAGAYKDKSKPADVRLSNINAAKGECAQDEVTGEWRCPRTHVQ